MIFRMDLEKKIGQMEHNIQGSMKWGQSIEKGYLYRRIQDNSTRDTLCMILYKDLGHLNLRMGADMRDSGFKMLNMEKECTLGQEERSMKESILMIKGMDMENLRMKMEYCIKENGTKGRSMVLAT